MPQRRPKPRMIATSRMPVEGELLWRPMKKKDGLAGITTPQFEIRKTSDCSRICIFVGCGNEKHPIRNGQLIAFAEQSAADNRKKYLCDVAIPLPANWIALRVVFIHGICMKLEAVEGEFAKLGEQYDFADSLNTAGPTRKDRASRNRIPVNPDED